MTGIAQTGPRVQLPPTEPYVGDRTPHLFVVTLIGAALVLGTIMRLIQADSSPAHPLSGAPVDGPVAATFTLPAEASARIRLTGAPSRVLGGMSDADPVPVGPPGVPRRGGLAFHLSLTTDAPTSVLVTAEFLTLSGRLREATADSHTVTPGPDGSAVVEASVPELLYRNRAGIYRVTVAWAGQPLAEAQLALGARQPSGVAIFPEPRPLVLKPGTYTGVRFDTRGDPGDRLQHRFGRRVRAEAVAYARFGGTPHVLVGSGPLAKYWLPLGEGIGLR